MYQSFKGGLGGIALAKHGRSRAINAENPHGEKGKGGMAASHLGPSRKGSPCLNDIEPGATVTLAEMEGPGEINHIWITVDNKTTDADCFVLRDLVIRMYWDDKSDDGGGDYRWSAADSVGNRSRVRGDIHILHLLSKKFV